MRLSKIEKYPSKTVVAQGLKKIGYNNKKTKEE
jgi:hypothetical protein